MAVYSIKDLEKLTGIKAHTLRIWEQRYRLVTPARTETNIRYYTDENLRHLFNIALLNRQGVKISRIARMRPDEIEARVTDVSKNTQNLSSQTDALTLAMIDMDEAAFDQIFSSFQQENGFERTMLELIYPFLDKLNVLWLTGSVSPAHEKFIGNLIRRKICSAIDKEKAANDRSAETFLLFLPEQESQELTLLFMHYILRNRGQRVIYLGSNVSLSELRDAVQAIKPAFVFTILNEPPHRQSFQVYLDSLALATGNSKLLLTGAQFFMQPVKLPANGLVINGLQETFRWLDEL